MSANITLFQSDPNNSSGGAADYVIDNFRDTSNPATTDNANTNPLSLFFVNSDTPQYQAKTLFVKDLVLISDRTKWIKNKPTYIVEFTETSPQIVGYVYGNVRLRNQVKGLTVEIRYW